VSHATSALLLNVGLVLAVLLVVALALRAILRQRRQRRPMTCIGCPSEHSCYKQSCDRSDEQTP